VIFIHVTDQYFSSGWWLPALVSLWVGIAVLLLMLLLRMGDLSYVINDLGFRFASHPVDVGTLHESQIVVYLRSFMDDELSPNARLRPLRWTLDQAIATLRSPKATNYAVRAYSRPEWKLCRQMYEVGRVIALGRPGETLPPVGAERLYLGHDDWQPVVANLLASATLVVVYVDTLGEGLKWELRQLRAQDTPDKVVYFISDRHDKSDSSNHYAKLAKIHAEVFRQELPSITDAKCMAFGPHWEPIEFTGKDALSKVVAHFVNERQAFGITKKPLYFRLFDIVGTIHTVAVMLVLAAFCVYMLVQSLALISSHLWEPFARLCRVVLTM
jgi:hypothetical protein